MDFSMISTVISITVICYMAGVVAKLVPAFKDEFIPALVGTLGGILGVVGMLVIPDFPAQDVMNAIAVGVVSGLASTGANQLFKQFTE